MTVGRADDKENLQIRVRKQLAADFRAAATAQELTLTAWMTGVCKAASRKKVRDYRGNLIETDEGMAEMPAKPAQHPSTSDGTGELATHQEWDAHQARKA